jgi:chemotaxis protein methyltransferase CheR
MFRDPEVYQAIRKDVVTLLRTYPFLKIWHAGCASGEEVYSLAILLKEEGLYDRCQIYATDFNNIALKKAKDGIYPLDRVKKFTSNYIKSGGKQAFSDYYITSEDKCIIDRKLKKNLTFANHNLATDTAFGEMNLILCRNVMIYFDQKLQSKVLELFYDSLIINGILCIGTKESLNFSQVETNFSEFNKKEKIYQKKRR